MENKKFNNNYKKNSYSSNGNSEKKPYNSSYNSGNNRNNNSNSSFKKKTYGQNEGRSYNSGNRYDNSNRYDNNSGNRYENNGGNRYENNGGNRYNNSNNGYNSENRQSYNPNFKKNEGYSKPNNYNRNEGYNRNESYNRNEGYKQNDNYKKPFNKKPYNNTYKPQNNAPIDYPTVTPAEVRLNKYIADAGICSRRNADMYISSGNVTVNGEVMTTLGYRVKPTDEVRFDGKLLSSEKKEYILLNKPKGFITTTNDEKGRKTVMDLVANATNARILPVGRYCSPMMVNLPKNSPTPLTVCAKYTT